jgi:UDP-N-acetylglucosamine 2-epimerase (non-hydrolysing)
VITDSGGVQEETTAMGIPCLTYRTTTERPVTVEQGTNRLVGMNPDALAEAAARLITRPVVEHTPIIPLWDGRAGVRAAAVIASFLGRGG